jgi:broad specificity phosphatase PhoE
VIPDVPTPQDLDRHCELGPLAALNFALGLTISALYAAHPELWLEDERGPQAARVPPHVRRFLDLVHRLDRAIARYRQTLADQDASERAPDDSDDIPF